MKRRKYYRQVKDSQKAEKRRKAVQRQELFETITKSLNRQGIQIDYDTSNKNTNLNLVTDVYAHIQPDINRHIQNVQTQMPTSTSSTSREEYLTLDQCGVCDGGVYECNVLDWNLTDCGSPGSISWMDCTGTCFGDTVLDECGICGGSNLPNTGICDCDGIPNGGAYYDNCGNCIGANDTACSQDCNGDYGGDAYEDICGNCVGGLTGQVEGWADKGCGCNVNSPVPTYPDTDGDGLGVCLSCYDAVDGPGSDNYWNSCTDADYGDYVLFTGEFNEDCIPRDDSNNCCVKYFCMEHNTSEVFVDTLFPLYNEANNYVFNYLDDISNCNAVESSFPMCTGFQTNAPVGELTSGQHNCGVSPYLDECGMCPLPQMLNVVLDDSATVAQYFYNHSKDCSGQCFGTAYVDDCGVCCGGNTGIQCSTGPNQGAKDCYGVCNGGNLEYECDSSHLDFVGGAVNTFCGCPDGAANCGDNRHGYQDFIDCNGVCFYNNWANACDITLPYEEQDWQCLNYIQHNLDEYGHCCLTGLLGGDDSEIVTAYADTDNDGVGNTSGPTIQICSTAVEPFYWTSYNYYWTQIGDDCYGLIDDCGVCQLQEDRFNQNMDECGVCHAGCTEWNDSNCSEWNSSCVGCTIVGSVNFNPDALVSCDDNIGSGCIDEQTGNNCCCETLENYLDDNCTLSDVIDAGNDDCDTGDVCLPDGYIDPSTCLVDDITGCCETQVSSQTGGGPAFCNTIGCMNLCYDNTDTYPQCCPGQSGLTVDVDAETVDGYNVLNYTCDTAYYQAWCISNEFGVGPDLFTPTIQGVYSTDATFVSNVNFFANTSDNDISIQSLQDYYTIPFNGAQLLFIQATIADEEEINIVASDGQFSNLTGDTYTAIPGFNIFAVYDMWGFNSGKWAIYIDSSVYLEDFVIKPGQAFVFIINYSFGDDIGQFNFS